MEDNMKVQGRVHAVLTDEQGRVVAECVTHNLVTATGDQFYAARAAGASGAPGPVTGMKLGTSSTAPAKTGAGAALVAYVPDSHQALSGTPVAAAGVATYTAIWEPGKGTTASPVTEVVLVNDTLADATSPAGATVCRALLEGISAKPAGFRLTVIWNHTVLGA